KVLAYASGIGNLTKTKVDDMSKQHRVILQGATPGQNGASAPKAEAAAAQPRQNGVGLVAVAAGSGLSGIFKGLGTDAVVEGGQTMNPSTQDMLKAVESVPLSGGLPVAQQRQRAPGRGPGPGAAHEEGAHRAD